jgi:hypothetical protein
MPARDPAKPVPMNAPPSGGGSAPERMINLSDRDASIASPSATGEAAGNTQGNTGQGTIGTTNSPAAPPAGKAAPAKIDGVNVPSGSRLVEDPDLIREILDANKKR